MTDTMSVKPMTIIKIARGRFSERKHVSTDAVDIRTKDGVEVNKTKTSLSKRLMDSEAVAKAGTLYRHLDDYLTGRSLPIKSILGNNCYAIPVDLLEETIARIECDKVELECIIKEKLRSEWAELLETAQEELGGLFDPADYHLDRMVSKMYLDYTMFDISMPSTEGSLTALELSAIAKAEKQFTDWYAEIESVLALGVQEMVDGLMGKIAGTTDSGKAKTITTESLNKFEEFFTLLAARNVTGSATIQQAAELGIKLKSAIADSGKMVQQPGMLRDYITTKMVELKDSVGGLVVDAPTRYFAPDSDEE